MPGEEIQIFVKGLENTTRIVRLDEDASITALKKAICKMFDLDEDSDLRMLFTTKDLREKSPNGRDMYLKDYEIKSEATITLVLRLHGGSNQPPEKMYDGEVELTTLPDMFTLDDSPDGQRAKMPCGHAISPESLTAFCRSLLTAGKYDFRCPYKAKASDPHCNSKWEYFTVKRLAVLTDGERDEFETKMAENYLRKSVGIQDCPKCKSFCERQKKTDRRVVCPICTRRKSRIYEFCWFCLKTWLSSGTSDCGNVGCTGEDPRLRLIKTCPKKKVVEVECPAIRACPTCGLLIEHKANCKHMDCPCGQKFCFICLQKGDSNGRYPCGLWNSKCEPAPIQTDMPGQ
ncbi:uncharacterized protein LOC127882289 [Dreissena polymorpha]|uniref:RBR-type E3 ubiquitin transferase n=1 Tax=Dreissena polymorpha TaxID=45954 RepID=A0A9D4GGS6_DREPO|nr:uncharacterized protein LOC127882289 [Dreissena polymorpha]KAH3817096.1 hypothetical protein DPMN_118625 [Dreissena polymorpha]